ncbi:MAG: radical SAM protein [Methanotrichaceae archaeon]|nr:radical SAM protein [Methanotrichaceae archaeon]
MKILFLNPNWNSISPRIFPGCKRPHHPLELLYPATILSKNHEILVIDAFLERLNNKDLQLRLRSFEPEVVVMSTAPSYLFWRCCPLDISLPKKVSHIVRSSSKAISIIIGPHPTVSPKWVLKECQCDDLVRGEAELSVAEFINSGLGNLHVRGLCSGELDNGVAFVEDLNLLPKINFDFLPLGPYHSHSFRFREGASVEFSRGCTFQCSFCFKQWFRNKYRMRPIDKVIEEIEELKNLGYRYIYFIDELFNRDSKSLRKLLEELKKVGIAWGCQCRPDIMTPDLLLLMKNAGCYTIEYGLESLSQKISQSMKKGMDREKSLDSINLTAKLGIETIVFFLYGAPNEANHTLSETVDMLCNLDKQVSFSSGLIIPYPTTQIFSEMIGGKDFFEKEDWEICAKMVGNTNEIPRKNLEKIIILSHLTNHLRSLQIPKFLIRSSANIADVLPAAAYSKIFALLLTIRKQRDIR